LGLAAVILAAGKGTRMKSKTPKVLHQLAGRPMLRYVVDAVTGAGVDRILVVAGPEAAAIGEVAGSRAEVVVQEQQLGTAHALLQAESVLKDYDGDLVVLPGDTPLLRVETLKRFYADCRRQEGIEATVLTVRFQDPTGYGRVIRNQDGKVGRIVEHRDATQEELLVNEVNAGVYCFKPSIFEVLRKISPCNVQNEYYLPDVVKLLQEDGVAVGCWEAPDPEEFRGVNDRRQLAAASQLIRRRILECLMDEGVTVVDPSATYVDPDVVIGQDTVIFPFTFLEGKTVVGTDCRIGPWARISDSHLGAEVEVQNAVITGSVIENQAAIGPYTYIRPGCLIGSAVKIGGFVEVKKSKIGPDSKVPHLSYIGDAEIGRNVNVGAGTITCNYDGAHKWPTIIEEDAFIGSNANLVAPVRVGKGSYIAAGSTITKDVPPGALGVARGRQTNIPDWRKKGSPQ
jgi:bifunctional UDP-N-acetylglucosamine pyrophosphorylase/glucosamine-1-phosphate N-acetyltransferase